MEWQQSVAEDDAMASALFRAKLHADMAGQLFVRAVEVPEVSTPVRALAAADSRQSFMRLTFQQALDAFLERRLVTPEQYAQLTDIARRDAFSAVRFTSEALVGRARELIRRHLSEGGSLRSFITGLREGTLSLGIEPATPGYIENVFRTNVQSSYGAGRLRQLEHPAVLDARPYVQYRTAGDNRVRPSHAALDGVVFNRAEDPGWRRFAPPLGYQCFPAGTLVEGAIQSGLRAWYAGELVELRTEGGRLLRVTPNHPLATPSGFVAAGDVREGEHVLGYVGDVDGLLPRGVNPEHDPTPIEQVFGALAKRRGTVALRPGPHDLHGDAALVHGNVDVVDTLGVLGLDREAYRTETHGDHGFTTAYARAVAKAGERHLALGVVGLGDSARSLPGGRALTLDSGSVHSGPLQPLRLGTAAYVDAALSEPAGQSLAADAQVIGQLLHGHAPVVQGDRVHAVRRVPFAGHVYDLQSVTGWIVAGGIVTSNCRCAMVTLRSDAVGTVTLSTDIPAGVGPDPGWAGPGA